MQKGVGVAVAVHKGGKGDPRRGL